MIIKLFIINDNKLILHKFKINKINNKIIISTDKNLIKVPIYNNFSGLSYFIITIPYELIIYDDKIFNPYIILDTNTINNELDFFYNIKEIIKNTYNLNFIEFNNLNIINIYNYYENIINYKNDINLLWLKINILKLYLIFSLIHKSTIAKEFNIIKNYKNNIFSHDIEIKMSFNEWNTYIIKPEIKIISVNKYYYFNDNKIKIISITLNNNKKEEINIENKLGNLNIKFNNNKEINNFESNLYYYYPKINISINYLIYLTFINNDINLILIQFLLKDNFTSIEYTNILNYYENNKLSNIISYLNLSDMEILSYNSISDDFFINLTKNM
jgi:hypothetical protein